MLNGLLLELKNSFDCSFAPTFVSINHYNLEKYVRTEYMGQFLLIVLQIIDEILIYYASGVL